MRALERVRPAWWGALLVSVVVLALGMAWHEVGRSTDRWNRLLELEVAVESLAREAEAEEDALRARVSRPAPELGELVAAYASEGEASVEEEAVRDLPEGYRLRAGRVELRDWPWGQVRRFVEEAEGQRPPWRLRRVVLESGFDGLRGELRVEALDRLGEEP